LDAPIALLRQLSGGRDLREPQLPRRGAVEPPRYHQVRNAFTHQPRESGSHGVPQKAAQNQIPFAVRWLLFFASHVSFGCFVANCGPP